MSLIEQTKELLKGIDETELNGGWWETSTGAEFVNIFAEGKY